jgi:membrane peptidoglycan carboxypeptidase
MIYSTVANGGVSYYPRLIKDVVDADGKSLLGDDGQPVIPRDPKVRGDLRNDFTAQQIELARRGLWQVVNEPGGTGSKARVPGVEVAGKTGTAQAMLDGKKDNVAWFSCFAPYNNPKYTVIAMVQGSEGHGGSVAAPIAGRILERALAMEEGKFEPELAWLEPANKPNPFQLVVSVDYKDSPNLPSSDEEGDTGGDDNSARPAAQMAPAGAEPDVEPEADARGKVAKKAAPVARAVPAAAPAPPPQAQRPNFFQRLFGARPAQQPAQPVRRATPPPGRR